VIAIPFQAQEGAQGQLDVIALSASGTNVGTFDAGNAPRISSMRSQTEETFVEDVMGKQRQSWTVEEKLGIVLAVLSERPSVAEIARQRGVNENQIYLWKEQFLAAGRQGLNGAKAQTADQRLEAENSQLKKLLGEKALEMEILKKVSRF
jgi:transposase-like protein